MENIMNKNTTTSTENLYHLNGKISVKQAIPFGLQHILAMFVANIAPIFIVAAAVQTYDHTYHQQERAQQLEKIFHFHTPLPNIIFINPSILFSSFMKYGFHLQLSSSPGKLLSQ